MLLRSMRRNIVRLLCIKGNLTSKALVDQMFEERYGRIDADDISSSSKCNDSVTSRANSSSPHRAGTVRKALTIDTRLYTVSTVAYAEGGRGFCAPLMAPSKKIIGTVLQTQVHVFRAT